MGLEIYNWSGLAREAVNALKQIASDVRAIRDIVDRSTAGYEVPGTVEEVQHAADAR